MNREQRSSALIAKTVRTSASLMTPRPNTCLVRGSVGDLYKGQIDTIVEYIRLGPSCLIVSSVSTHITATHMDVGD